MVMYGKEIKMMANFATTENENESPFHDNHIYENKS